MKPSRLAIACAVLALALTGCNSDKHPASKSSGSPKPSSSATGIISPKLPDIPKFKGKSVGIIRDVKVGHCDLVKGAVKATGTAKNSASTPEDLVIVVSWAKTSTSDVVARGVTALKAVAPGATQKWSVEANLSDASSVACVPTALRGQLR